MLLQGANGHSLANIFAFSHSIDNPGICHVMNSLLLCEEIAVKMFAISEDDISSHQSNNQSSY